MIKKKENILESMHTALPYYWVGEACGVVDVALVQIIKIRVEF